MEQVSDASVWRRMLDAIGEAVIATDLDGTITFWNVAAEQLYGWRAEEVLGRSVLDVTPAPTTRAEAARIMGCMVRGESWRGRFEVRRRDGSSFPALVTDTPLLDATGQLVGIIGVSRDLSSLEAAEARARRGEREAAVAMLARVALDEPELVALLERAVDVVAVECRAPLVLIAERRGQSEGVHLVAGRGWRRDGGAEAQDAPLALGALPGASAVVVEDYASSGPPPTLLAEHGIRAGVATTIPGRPGGFGVLGVYATEPRAFERSEVAFIETVAGLLGGAVARSDGEEELRRVAAELRASDDIRLAFLRATSHELRTPLAAVRGFAETLREHDDALAPEQRRHLLGVLQANAERLDALIQDLLDVDRLSSGLVQASREPTRFDRLVRSVVEVVEHPDHRVDLDLDEVVLALDVPKFERVVHNLVANAVRHTPPGGRITVRLRHQDGGAVLAVEDEGRGIAPAYIDRIFEPFVQGPEQQHAATPGAGLGLALVREIVALHDGTTRALNLPGKGARFEVWLPG